MYISLFEIYLYEKLVDAMLVVGKTLEKMALHLDVKFIIHIKYFNLNLKTEKKLFLKINILVNNKIHTYFNMLLLQHFSC